jgi:Zn-dependent peptidase ImmA (M78 family)
MAARYSLARKKAIELLKSGRVRRAPVPVEELARFAGAKIRYKPFPGELSGMVHRRPDGNAVIGVNSLHLLTRRRFTIAHELGHLILHKDEKLHVDEGAAIGFRTPESSLAVDDNEIEANQFAAELLMPQDLIRRDLKKLPSDIEPETAVAQLARRYQVSIQAMTIRLNGLGVLA